MRVGLTDHFHTSGSDVRMDGRRSAEICCFAFYALGTSTLSHKRMGGVRATLCAMRRRYVTKQNLRAAIGACGQRDTRRARATFGARRRLHVLPTEKFAAGPNLLTEWHIRLPWPRHHGLLRHIDKKAACNPFTGQTLLFIQRLHA